MLIKSLAYLINLVTYLLISIIYLFQCLQPILYNSLSNPTSPDIINVYLLPRKLNNSSNGLSKAY